jgi:hypothetical protein
VTHLAGRCRTCGNDLVYVRDVGWFDPDATHAYDICPVDRYGNHAAESVVVVRPRVTEQVQRADRQRCCIPDSLR